MVVEFRLLGPVRVTAGGNAVVIGGRQRTALLAILLLNANRVVGTDRLATVLWGARQPRNARSTLQVRVSQLRRVLAEAGLGDDRLAYRSPGYLLRVGAGELDLQRFLTLADRGRDLLAAGDHQAAAGLLHEALELFTGHPFEDVTAPPLDAERDRIQQRRLAARTDRIDADVRAGLHDTVLGELTALAEQHPLDERLGGLLMLALHRAGRRSDALAHFRRIRKLSTERDGLEPSEELRRLEKAILTDAPVTVLVPAQLPVPLVHFTGRDDDLRRLDDLAPRAGAVAVPVVVSAIGGIAGVGKTALAVHWAHRARTRFPDGQLYVNLRGFDPAAAPMTPTGALRTLLDGLGVPAQRVPYQVDAQSSLYRSILARQRVLVLLDNARDAEQVRPLLPGSPGSMALVTSRNQLTGLAATDGARLLALAAFGPDGSRELLAGRLGPDRITAEPEATGRIIERCAGLPLALSVVAAQAAANPGLALAAFADDLTLDSLTVGDVGSDVRAVFSSSYRVLRDDTKRLVRLAGLHPGPDLTAGAAASLAACSPAEARTGLAELVRAGFATEHTPGRYGMHDLLREYAADMARRHETEPDRRAALHRCTDHYLHTACSAAEALVPHGDPLTPGQAHQGVRPEPIADRTAAVAWFTAELPVLLEVFHAAVTARLDRRVIDLAWALARFLDLRRRYHDMTATQQAALTAATRLGDDPARARAHRLIGFAASREARTGEALEHLSAALDVNRQIGDHLALGHTGMTLAQLTARTGDHTRALEHARTAYAAFQTADSRYGQANALNSIGWYHAKLGEYEATVEFCTWSAELAGELGDARAIAAAADSLGYAHHHLGDHEQAVRCYQRAVQTYAAADDRYFEADTLLHLTDTLQAMGRTAPAIEAATRAQRLLDALEHPDADRARRKLEELGTHR
ncbi:AfsR/SARP family transcriptional regulator [Actinoplanes derwentensis]|uniref:DNA-binding transcriptional activator of the SARP family n=1 Tax=Actinoplanes derwentensis TaxID=113562 RepID=A0A1H1VTR0_9ACTN|nr:BTAD domain-containing putative transcriptional regulator [Actinoplanes derwentensis]SDS88304.1 DNA-binding transcriptional activator of the SARP family [Actinoplanes derwentensis]